MHESGIILQIEQKDIDINNIVSRVIDKPEYSHELVDVIKTQKGSIKFRCEKVLRLTSEQRPDLIYPYFNFYINLLDSDNTFLKCGAILTIANLTGVDDENQFEKIFDKYYSFVAGPSLICAANVIVSSVKIAKSKPSLTQQISKEMLKIEQAEYLNKGIVSPECKNVACGKAIYFFEQLYTKIEDKEPVIEFIKKQVNSTRKSVSKSAEKFLKKYKLSF